MFVARLVQSSDMVMPGGLVKISQSGRSIEAIAASRESVPPTVLVELDLETFRLPPRLAFGHDLQRGLFSECKAP